MNLTRDRVFTIGWAVLVAITASLTGAIMLRANSVKSQVQQAERQIVALRHEKELLETEYETRANQQQLSQLNQLEFGYKAPEAAQYIEGQRQVAMLGKPRDPGAPAPIRMASADDDEVAQGGAAGVIPAMVSPFTGKAMAAEVHGTPERHAVTAKTLAQRLAHLADAGHAKARVIPASLTTKPEATRE